MGGKILFYSVLPPIESTDLRKCVVIMGKKYECPVCYYDKLEFEAYDSSDNLPSYEMCPCCGFQFGLDDYPNREEKIKKWRTNWFYNGGKWFSSSRPPVNWNPLEQLSRISEEI